MEYLIKNTAPGVYSISFSDGGIFHQLKLDSRETVFFQLLLQSINERLRDYLPQDLN